MKKLIFVLFGLGMGVAVMAQTVPEKKTEMNQLRANERTRKTHAHQVNKDLAHARIHKAVQDHKAVAADNRAIKQNKKDLKNMEVSHPVAKAKRKNKVADENRKDEMN
jgi:uncharacterized protein HemX